MSDKIADTLAALLGPCRCIPAYKDRGLIDPFCVRCDYEDDAREYIDGKERELAALRAEVARLTAAISRHRSAVWGDGPVEHPEDVELYAALGAKEKE